MEYTNRHASAATRWILSILGRAQGHVPRISVRLLPREPEARTRRFTVTSRSLTLYKFAGVLGHVARSVRQMVDE